MLRNNPAIIRKGHAYGKENFAGIRAWKSGCLPLKSGVFLVVFFYFKNDIYETRSTDGKIQEGRMESYIVLGYAVFLGTLFVGGAILSSKLLAFHSPTGKRKVQPYECSEEPIGEARIRFKVGFYIFALLFLLFDIESLFLFPCLKIFRAVVTGQAGAVSPILLVVELALFVSILVFALVYAWRKGVLTWK